MDSIRNFCFILRFKEKKFFIYNRIGPQFRGKASLAVNKEQLKFTQIKICNWAQKYQPKVSRWSKMRPTSLRHFLVESLRKDDSETNGDNTKQQYDWLNDKK